MATLTIRNLSDGVVERIKAAARQHGHSMEQEVRELLQRRYAVRTETLQRIRNRWDSLPPVTTGEAERWRGQG